MPSSADELGSLYRVRLVREAGQVGPGLVLCLHGIWNLGSHTLHEEASAVLWRREQAHGQNGYRQGGTPLLGALEPLSPISPARTRTVMKPWGFEKVVNPEIGLLKVIAVAFDKRTSLQSHERKDEALIRFSGDGGIILEGDDTVHEVAHIEPGTVHRAVGPVQLLEGSTYDPDDVIRHEDDFGR